MTDVNYRYSIPIRNDEIKQQNNIHRNLKTNIERTGTSNIYYNPSQYQQQQQQQQNPALISRRQFPANPIVSPQQQQQQQQKQQIFGRHRNQLAGFGQQSFQRIPYPFNGPGSR